VSIIPHAAEFPGTATTNTLYFCLTDSFCK